MFTGLDWAIVGMLLVILVIAAKRTSKYNRSVADFLAANRCAGRYVLAVSDGIASICAISVVAMFEAYFKAGFTFVWWGILMNVVLFVVSLSGWIQYRFRQTRALTMAQFIEVRYSKKLRVAAGITAWVSGTINFGIFPAAGARFFQRFCGLPEYLVPIVPGASYHIDLVYAGVMIILIGIALYFTFSGGQIAVIVTDFLQGMFFNIAMVLVVGYAMYKFSWSDISGILMDQPAGQSMLDPFDTASTRTFDAWYYIIGSFVSIWCFMCWLGNQGYSSAARNAHEARMGRALGSWRIYIQNMIIIFLPIAAFVMMRHSGWTTEAAEVNNTLAQIDNATIRNQVGVSVMLTQFIPVGLLGAFAAVMLAAFISTHDTYLHSWGSIFIQDVLLPLRKGKKLSKNQHMKYLKRSIFGVAAFIFIFSLFFPQTDFILMFFALTGTLFIAGAGTVVVMGLYWKRGTTAGAWAALSMGWIAFIGGLAVDQYWPKHYGDNFPEKTAEVFYDESATVCTMPVKLEPGQVYWIGINGGGKYGVTGDVKEGFVNKAGVAAKPFVILFATADLDNKPTEISPDMIELANAIISPKVDPNAPVVEAEELPEVVSVNVVNFASNVAASLEELTIKFDEPMNTASHSFLWNMGKKFQVMIGDTVLYLDAQRRLFIAILISIILYVSISLFGKRNVFNLDKMLHRGKYAIEEDKTEVTTVAVPRWQAVLGINKDFTLPDKVVYIAISFWTVLWGVLFFAVLIYRSYYEIPIQAWSTFWMVFVWMILILAIVSAIWFGIGGVMDLKKMFKRLSTLERDENDDGEIASNDEE